MNSQGQRGHWRSLLILTSIVLLALGLDLEPIGMAKLARPRT
jgi:hypothetical protein